MSEFKNEQISAFMDGETDTNEPVSALSRDEALRQTWGRYHLISDCMKQRCPQHIDMDLVNRVASAIDAEPTVLAPERRAAVSFIKPLAGFAIAASVATVAILGVQQNRVDDVAVPSAPQLAATVDISPVVPRQFQPVSTEETRPQSEFDREEANSRLSSYLVNYNEYRTHTGMHGMLPYVRVVAHGKDQ